MATKDSTLRIAHVMLYVLTFSGGLLTCLGLGWASKLLEHNCLLYATMSITESVKNNSITIDVIESQWGDAVICSYCVFSSACAAIYAVIWFWFYLLLSDWKKSAIMMEDSQGSPPDARLLLPSMVFNFISWVVCVVSLGFLSVGRKEWCKGVTHSLGEPCSYLSEVTWTNFENGHTIYTYALVALVGNWLLCCTLTIKVGIASARLYRYVQWDFKQQEKREDVAAQFESSHHSNQLETHSSVNNRPTAFTRGSRTPLGGADSGPLLAAESSESSESETESEEEEEDVVVVHGETDTKTKLDVIELEDTGDSKSRPNVLNLDIETAGTSSTV